MTRLEEVVAELLEAAGQGVRDACEHVLEVANRKVPIEEGTLQRSGDISYDPQTRTGTVYYDTPYAVRQHEDQDLRHDRGREAKWLEKAVASERRQVAQIIADAARKAG